MRDALEREAITDLAAMADRGELALRVALTYPMEQAAAAHQRLAEGKLRGRLVLTLAD